MRASVLLAAFLVFSSCATAPPKSRSPEAQSLHDEIARMDRLMFEAFNAHDLEKLKTWFAEDLEFYHDAGGLTSYDQTLGGIAGMFAQNNGLRRDLVGPLEVYPIKDYGAVEIGTHRFCHVENGKDDCGVFKFVHVWRKQDSNWKVTRVVSYDH